MIDIDISTTGTSINGGLTTNSTTINSGMGSGGSNGRLSIRVTNLENNAVGDIELAYDETASVVSLTTKNTLGEDVGTARTISLPAGLSNVSYNEEESKIILTMTDNTIKVVNLKSSFDALQRQIDELELKKLDKVAYLTAEDIDDYFEE